MMGIRKQPSVRSYWQKSSRLLHCPAISSVTSRNDFSQSLVVSILNNAARTIERSSPTFDKYAKTQWLIDEIRNKSVENWNLGKFVTVDKMMVMYKGKYCSIRQYLPNKPVKWGVKIWCLADSVSKYV